MKFKGAFLYIFLVALIFINADGLIQYFWEYLAITSSGYYGLSPLTSYIIGKFLVTFILGGILLLFLDKKNLDYKNRNLLLIIILTIILELRYLYIYDYTYTWHIINMINHFLILYITMYYISKIMEV